MRPQRTMASRAAHGWGFAALSVVLAFESVAIEHHAGTSVHKISTIPGYVCRGSSWTPSRLLCNTCLGGSRGSGSGRHRFFTHVGTKADGEASSSSCCILLGLRGGDSSNGTEDEDFSSEPSSSLDSASDQGVNGMFPDRGVNGTFRGGPHAALMFLFALL